MRLEKSPFESFVDLLRERMRGRTLLCYFNDVTMAEVDKSISGRIRQIGVLRSGPLSIPSYPGLHNRSIEVFVLTNWAKVPSVVFTLYVIDGEHYRAEIIFDGKPVTPYDATLLNYLKTFQDELEEVRNDDTHEV